jgi:hypothetical protein
LEHDWFHLEGSLGSKKNIRDIFLSRIIKGPILQRVGLYKENKKNAMSGRIVE